ncbi:sensor of ECF-type sigma factor [Flavobacterium silvaticum]|uniref:Sensor of ECF-type sigma factor n=1 Tax=Flavobacterium silvaticum TaxID=1852020 RepID=A0A972FK99_9FLAO|nr:sensor of ECF-type sigma factor [Flavobacterium silvaticum]NMH27318.1 sensor of ECF-type sigma factor [Flavobacterium silvaticum]
MKTKILIPVLCLLFSSALFAQGGRLLKEKKEELKSVKVAFITDALDLTTAEAQKFWPVYNKFEDDQFALRQQKMEAYKDRMNDGSLETMTEKEAVTMLGQMEETEADLYQLKKKLIADLKTIIPAKKIILLKKAEEDFNRKLLQQYRKKRDK